MMKTNFLIDDIKTQRGTIGEINISISISGGQEDMLWTYADVNKIFIIYTSEECLRRHGKIPRIFRITGVSPFGVDAVEIKSFKFYSKQISQEEGEHVHFPVSCGSKELITNETLAPSCGTKSTVIFLT